MAKKVFYKVLGILAIAAVFAAGIWLGRLYSAAGGPGASAVQRFGSTVVRQIRQLWEPSPPATVESEYSNVPRISLEELKEKLDAGADLVVVDVRSKEEFDQGHIPGAVSIPYAEIEARYRELPRDKEIITYCARC
jgi:predicted sulfurtransferase